MKNKKWRLLFFGVYILCLILSCSKDKLTKETQIGANTFSCKIDGNVFLPSKEESTFSGSNRPFTVSNSYINGFTLFAKQFLSSGPAKTILITFPYLQKTGIYSLINSAGYGEYKIDYAFGPTYRTNNTYSGAVNITRCDTVNQIYSGTFSFTAIDDNTKKTVNVTDGRFDVKR